MAAIEEKANVSLEAALSSAAEILTKSRHALITGLGADVAGARAAFRLAARIGGTVDFLRAPGAHNFYAAFADKGLMFTTPREASARADVLLLIGPDAGRSDIVHEILTCEPVLSVGEGVPHEVVWLCSGGADNALSEDEAMKVGGDVAALPGILAVLNACLNAHPLPAEGYGGLSAAHYEEIAGRLMTARFGVIAWSPADLDALAIESLVNAVTTLNQTTRVTMLPLGLKAGSETATLVSGWTTGFPPRTSFARGFPEYDPWRFDAARMVAAEECDALIWLSAFDPVAPSWKTRIPTIVLTPPGTSFSRPPDIHIKTAIPGVGADAEFYSETLQTLVHTKSAAVTDAPTPASVLSALFNRLEGVTA
jgi:formylmethanofuran dehydrogenase subunit B